MTNATDVIAHLLPRKAATIVERHTGLPFGWGLWLRALPERLGRITRERADSVVALFAARAPRPADPVPPVPGRIKALRSLLYQGWGPPSREERWMRWTAGFTSTLMHVAFFMFLLWVALVNIPPPEPDTGDDSSRVRLEMIGQGSPDEVGGAPQAGEPTTAAPSPSERPASAATTATETAPPPSAEPPAPVPTEETAAAAPEVMLRQPDVQARELAPPALAQQPIRVTEVPEPTRAYVLPPTTPREPELRQPAPREASVRAREVAAPVEAPVLRHATPTRVVDVAPVAARPADVREREVLAPAPQPRTVAVPTREVAPRAVSTPQRDVRQAQVREPSPAPPSPTPSASSVANAPASTPSQTTARSNAPSPSPSTAPRGTAPIAGAPAVAPTAKPGGWTTPNRADDWGNARRNIAGDSAADGQGKAGLYNADGSLRVPGDAGENTAQRGAPGGDNDHWTRERLEESGTWLQRPPYDYEPTSFDKYWVPSESLLAEWVRRNVKEMEISIPGTNLKLKCTISVLQLGGGCGLGNFFPDPPVARPPPEIPVKRKPIPTDS
ncbi:hypothetical protein [Pseudoxanthomonas sp. Root630]|uniref:hypothetical protein n=1 Tax=Pseudoxanthomonas sp. Root630 TaxID=1736574 RepID=UPI000702866D|nr:hypothetical protein [Pseudoxanthomonas sp. Root630]KRA50560.1 hypothetical protein ASD72_17860 [Pseudoxanthomonas sp. Root630]